MYKYINVLTGIAVNKAGRWGISLAVVSFFLFILFEILQIVGVLDSYLIGLYYYLALPTLFVVGIALAIYGWFSYKKETGKSAEEILSERFDRNALKGGVTGSEIFHVILVLSTVSILFLGASTIRMLHYMDEPAFCGTACHSVMDPEWTAYQESPHSRVACVQCHVGEGLGALIDSKINGTWQMISVTFDLLQRPIPTPVHQLRPARETCEKCHWPDKFYGARTKTFVHYGFDENSTPKYTNLLLKVDAGAKAASSGIHWHVAKDNEVRYASVDDKREEIIWVEARQKDGSYKRYQNKTLLDFANKDNGSVRVMDCVDCHNRVTHVYEDPSDAVDKRIRQGLLDRRLPYIKRVSLDALTSLFTTHEKANKFIATKLRNFYAKNYPLVAASESNLIDKAIKTLQKTYRRNVHYEMNINWNSYPNHLGHRGNKEGCFRCHNPDMVDSEGNSIPHDCTMCHSISSYDSDSPFEFLKPVKKGEPEEAMHKYLQNEYLNSIH